MKNNIRILDKNIATTNDLEAFEQKRKEENRSLLQRVNNLENMITKWLSYDQVVCDAMQNIKRAREDAIDATAITDTTANATGTTEQPTVKRQRKM